MIPRPWVLSTGVEPIRRAAIIAYYVARTSRVYLHPAVMILMCRSWSTEAWSGLADVIVGHPNICDKLDLSVGLEQLHKSIGSQSLVSCISFIPAGKIPGTLKTKALKFDRGSKTSRCLNVALGYNRLLMVDQCSIISSGRLGQWNRSPTCKK